MISVTNVESSRARGHPALLGGLHPGPAGETEVISPEQEPERCQGCPPEKGSSPLLL